ncbi:MAG: ATP-binding cassette domain-containing protein [Rhodospirillales bacterium]|nr:ATP-binding cassette domain-containing protein [Acetobacter sp.]
MTEAPSLCCTISHQLGALHIAGDFQLTKPWTVLFGPSGSGKSSILRAIAGFLTPSQGCILAGPLGRTLLDTGRHLNLPPHRRPVRFAPQVARLIPHRTVLANVRYGLPPGLPKALERELTEEVLELFRLRSLAERSPHHLSGGEMQRASVARAVLSAVGFDGPQRALLLLDEPFAGLDSALRDDIALGLRRFLLRWKVPVLSVSHDVAEAYLLEAEVIRLAEGQIIEQGPVAQVLAYERERIARQLRL